MFPAPLFSRPLFVKIALTLIAFFSLIQSPFAQTLSFPGALGFGQNAFGGRQGSVYHVTNLNDSGTGSFRDAVSQGNRIIVFDVGGTITLQSAVSCVNSLTIAGQTAPGGIAIIGHEVSFSARTNEIVRFIRVRPGSPSATGEDAINMGDGTNMMFDHVSLEFAGYNNIDAHGNNGSDSITVQNSILADPMSNGTEAKQGFGAHTEHLGGRMAWYYNLWVSEHNRQPLAKIDTIFVNNTEYNFQDGYTVAATSGAFLHDIINNYFVTGPADPTGADAFFQMNTNQTIYATGNLIDNNNDGVLNGGPIDPGGGYTPLTAPWSPLSTNTTVFTAAGAFHYDVSQAGALPYDQLDSLVISQIQTLGSGTAGTGAGLAGPGSSLYYDQTYTGLGNNGFGVTTQGTTYVDTDGDGMPDYWELAVSLNPNSASDAMTIAGDGYANIEHYLNWLAAPHALTLTNKPANADLYQFTVGFTNFAPVYSVSNPTNGTVVLNSGHVAQFTPNANFKGLGSFDYSATANDGSILSQTVVVCVSPLIVTQAVTTITSNVPPANNIFVALRTSSSGPSTTTIAAPAGVSYSGAAPAIGTAWNTVDLKSAVGTNSTVGSVSNMYSGLTLLNSSGTATTQTLSVAYTSTITTGTKTQPSGGTGENVIQPNGVMLNAWRNYYNASGNYLTFTVSGLTPSSPYDLYFEGGTTTSGQGAGIALSSANIYGSNATSATSTNATANSNSAFGSLFTSNGAGGYQLMPQGTSWNLLHGQSDATGKFSFLFNGPGSAAYLNGFQLVPITIPTFSGVTFANGAAAQFSYTGTQGRSYRLWAGTNLLLQPVTNTWRLLTNGIFSGGTDSFMDNQSTNLPDQFYLITVP